MNIRTYSPEIKGIETISFNFTVRLVNHIKTFMKIFKINPFTKLSGTVMTAILIITILICLDACTKKTHDGPLIKKWHMVKEYDSVVDLFGPSYTSIYDGKDGDYYQFETNDSLTMSKNGSISKTSYDFDEDKMQILLYNPYMVYNILELTDDKLEIYGTWARGSHTHLTYHIYFEK